MVSEDAGLYLEVTPTCPAYYALWDGVADDTTHEVRSKCSRRDNRQQLLARFNNAASGDTTPVRLSVRVVVPATD